MSNRWQVQAARARFSELLERTIAEGPQIVTRRGVEMAVVVSIAQWETLQQTIRPNLKELLLAPAPRVESLARARRPLARRPTPRFE